jgi:hypothetical protein
MRCPLCGSNNILYGQCMGCGIIVGLEKDQLPVPTPALIIEPEPTLEPILGWRFWSFKHGFLISGFPSITWEPRVPLKAIHQERKFTPDPLFKLCDDSPCDAHDPHANPGCGIYASKTPADIARSMLNFSVDIVGTVYLWGRIYEHEHGYRAQYAYPASFVAGPGIDDLAKTYDIQLDKENFAWKSVSRFASLSQSQSSYPPPYGRIPYNPSMAQQHYIQYLLRPNPSHIPNPLMSSSWIVPLQKKK